MKITPLDIRRKEFRRSVRGYLDEDVDVFLDTVADEVERVSKLNAELEKKVLALEEQAASHAHISEALEKTLVGAQLQSEEMMASAEKEGQSIVLEAEAKAKAMVDEFYGKTLVVQESLARLKLLEEDFRLKFKGLLQGYLKSLEDNPAVVALPDAPQSGQVASGGQGTDMGSAPEPPSLPKTEGTQTSAAGIHEDQTEEVAPPGAGESQPAEGGEVVQAGADEGESPVYFGQKNEELDDPFPDLGGATGKPRDFAW